MYGIQPADSANMSACEPCRTPLRTYSTSGGARAVVQRSTDSFLSLAACIISTLWACLHAYSKSDRERSVEESGRARKRINENIMAFKLKVFTCAEGKSSRGAARRFRVDEMRVREWRKL